MTRDDLIELIKSGYALDVSAETIVDKLLAAQQEGHGLSVRIEQRPDGGIRVWSPQVKGLILSGSDPVKVMADVWPAITALMEHKRDPEQGARERADK